MEYSIFIKKLEIDLRGLSKPLCGHDRELTRAAFSFIEEYLVYLTGCQAAISDRLRGGSKRKDYTKTNGLFTISLVFEYSENPILSFTLVQKGSKVYQLDNISRFSDGIKAGYVYVLKSQYGCKIGKSKKLEDRLKKFGVLLPFSFDIICHIKSIHYGRIERELHKIFEEDHINGEWFNMDDNCWEILNKYCEANGYELTMYEKQ